MNSREDNDRSSPEHASSAPSMPANSTTTTSTSTSTRTATNNHNRQGFFSSSTIGDNHSVFNDGKLTTSLYGELVRSRTVSAPPPGFDHGDVKTSPSLLYRNGPTQQSQSLAMNGGVAGSASISANAVTGGAHSTTAVSREDNGRRSTSFANLAAAFGESLAESMDDSFKDQRGIVQPMSRYPSEVQASTSSSFQISHLSHNHASTGKADVEGGSRTRNTTADTATTSTSASQSGGTTSSASEMNNYDRQGRHSASRLIGNLLEDNVYSGSGMLSAPHDSTGTDTGTGGDIHDMHTNEIRRGSGRGNTGGLIGSSSSASTSLFRPSPIVSRSTISSVGMTVEEPQDNYLDLMGGGQSQQNKNNESNNDGSKTQSSLAQAVSRLKNPSSHLPFSQNLDSSSTNYNESTDSDANVDTLLARSAQQLLGFNTASSNNLFQNQSSWLPSAHNNMTAKMKESNSGRSSAPPNLYVSSSVLREHRRGSSSQQHSQFSLNPSNHPHHPHHRPLPIHRDHLHPNSTTTATPSDILSSQQQQNLTTLDHRHVHATPSPRHSPEPPHHVVVSNNMSVSSSSSHHYSSNNSPEQEAIMAEYELAPFLHETNVTTKKPGQMQISQLPSKPSRGLVVLGVSQMLAMGKIGISELRTTCEAFGALETFRYDFATTKGVIFLSYFDLRSAEHAALELGGYLSRFVAADNLNLHPHGGHGNNDLNLNVKVKYCVPLHSSASKDDSLILLSNLPSDTDEDSLASMMSSYGAVKAVHYQMVSKDQVQKDVNSASDHNNYGSEEDREDEEEAQSYTVEFYDIQDAKHALMELVNCQPWGPSVRVQRGMTNPTIRRKGMKLLTLLGRWRQGQGSIERPTSFTPPVTNTPPPICNDYSAILGHGQGHGSAGAGAERSISSSASTSTSPLPLAPSQSGFLSVISSGVTSPNPNSPSPHSQISRFSSPAPQTQLLLSPDGQYSYVMVNPASSHAAQVQHILHPSHPPHYITTTASVHNPHQGVLPHSTDPRPVSQYWSAGSAPIPQHSSPYQTHVLLPPGAVTSSPYLDARLLANPGMHVFSNVAPGVHPDINAAATGGGGGVSNTNHRTTAGKKGSSSAGGKSRPSADSSEENMRLALDITSVKNGTDTRSSLMVRNIPNKYTQQMLLAEFSEFGHGSDKIDFFYLPIDFKNRCNRGYAFINFVDYQDIIPFHEQYNNKQWRVFNSDKVCAITYARIQGKAAMLKRFEHSALLDKNDEYRPLVFTSHGVNKGKRENFPSSPVPDTN